MKARTTIDPDLIALLGRKLYSSHPIPIVVRELLQNSVDACSRANIMPEIALKVDIRHIGNDKYITTITCRDNGIGMDIDELLNKFLCLGGTGKTDIRTKQTVGGFGIAKAAIMSGCYWSVRTHDLFVSSRYVSQDLDVAEREYVDGTTVKVIITENPTYATNREVARMIYGSDVDIDFTYRREGPYSLGKNFNDPHAGLLLPAKRIEEVTGWTGYSVDPVENPLFNISGYSLFRLNGLVQFSRDKVWGSDRQINLIVELTSTALPSSKEFPMSMSRETISNDNISLSAHKWVQKVDENYLTVERNHNREDVEDTEQLLHGYLLEGELGSGEYVKRDDETNDEREQRQSNEKEALKLKLGNLTRETVKNELDDYIVQDADMPLIMLSNYDKQTDLFDRDIEIMLLWSKLLEIVIPEGYEFGIGLTHEPFNSCVMLHSGVQFFIVNPDFVVENVRTLAGLIVSMYGSAIHESAHIYCDTHNERFTSLEAMIRYMSADHFMMQYASIKRSAKSINLKN